VPPAKPLKLTRNHFCRPKAFWPALQVDVAERTGWAHKVDASIANPSPTAPIVGAIAAETVPGPRGKPRPTDEIGRPFRQKPTAISKKVALRSSSGARSP
jgi:hypothetical protein